MVKPDHTPAFTARHGTTGGVTLRVEEDAEALARAAAAWLLARAQATAGVFRIALSGGTTPRRLYEILATAPFAARFPWARTIVFWGDERCVSQDDPLSNYGMARQALLDHVPIPAGQVHPAYRDGTPEAAARAYDAQLRQSYGAALLEAGRPLFDVVLLGLGTDGHTASLFPGTAGLTEREAWVTAVTRGVPQPRLTLTYPAINASAAVLFLVSGADKAEPLRLVLAGDSTLPATWVRGPEVVWFVDQAASG